MTRAPRAAPAALALALVLCVGAARAKAPGAYNGDPFADRVTTYTIGAGGAYGQSSLPNNVLGPPHGSENPKEPEDRAEHLLSLGDQGAIILEFTDNVCVDKPGPDLAVFENVFADDSDMLGSYFIETATVSVSEDGVHFFTFPCDFNKPLAEATKVGERYFFTPALFSGLAGAHPTFASYENGVSPTDPAVSGGDFFDLADVGLTGARFVKIVDTGRPGTPTQTLDDDGDAIDDTGNGSYDPIIKKFGFDLDAVAAIHSEPISRAGAQWSLYE
jgi:hypothetical protein